MEAALSCTMLTLIANSQFFLCFYNKAHGYFNPIHISNDIPALGLEVQVPKKIGIF